MGLVELLVLLAAVGGSSVVVGTAAWLWFRTKRLEDRIASGGDVSALVEEVEALRLELAASNEDAHQLRERVDFLERVLSAGEAGTARERLPRPGHDQPE